MDKGNLLDPDLLKGGSGKELRASDKKGAYGGQKRNSAYK